MEAAGFPVEDVSGVLDLGLSGGDDDGAPAVEPMSPSPLTGTDANA